MPSRTLRCGLLAAATAFAGTAQATIVQFQTVLGNFQVNLYDESTPQTVQNFLNYVNDGDFSQSFIHRSVPGFVIQGGGFTWANDQFATVPTDSAVSNEPQWSNVRGTIAMAKLGNNPNSATSQWFFNLTDNSANLDAQNGGFTVFGEVIDNGMNVVDTIAQFDDYDFGGAFTNLPLRNYSNADYNNNVQPTDDNLVMILDVVVIDSNTDTASSQCPRPNTSAGGGDGSTDPAAVDDAAVTRPNTPVVIDVAENDSILVGNVVDWSIEIAPDNGSLINHHDGTFTFTPDVDFTGPVSFSYFVTYDDCAISNLAVVMITVGSDGGSGAPGLLSLLLALALLRRRVVRT